MTTVRGCAGAKVRWCFALAVFFSYVVSGFPPTHAEGVLRRGHAVASPDAPEAEADSRTTSTQAPVIGFTGAPQLARAYDAIFDARFADVPELLDEACGLGRVREGGPAPDEACQVLDAVALWWQIQLDPFNRSRDEAFRLRVDTAIAAAAAWTAREPERAEAWFYLGGAYGARVQWRSLRRELLSAARDGKRIKDALERALELDPAMHDAYFGIGLYHYYADVAPTALKMLRWLLLLPGGDREQGLQEMLRARSRGELARSEADYQLHLLYLWYEKEPHRALDLLADLHRRHPHNPHFLQRIAEVHDVYLGDPGASLRSWEVLLEEARRERVGEAAMAEATARLGIALQLDRLSRTDAAVAHLRAVIEATPQAPYGALSRAHLQLGDALHRLGRREAAVAAYRAAIAAAPSDDPTKIKARAHAQLRAMK